MPSKTFIFIIFMIFFVLKNESGATQPDGHWKTWKYKLICSDEMVSCDSMRYLLAYLEIEFTDTELSAVNWKKQRPDDKYCGKLPVLMIGKEELTQPIAVIQFIAKLGGIYGDNEREAFFINIAADNVLDLQRDIMVLKKDVTFNLTELELLIGDNKYFVNNKLSWADLLFASTMVYLDSHEKRDILGNYSKLSDLLIRVLKEETINRWLEENNCTIQGLSINVQSLPVEMRSFITKTKPLNLDEFNSDWENSTYKLLYFNFTGQGEFIRCIIYYLGLQFSDIRIKRDDWSKMKNMVSFGQLPLLQIDNKIVLNQSVAIARYFARRANLVGRDDWEAMLVNTVVDDITELRIAMAPWYYAKSGQDKDRKKEHLINYTIPKFLKSFDNTIKNNGGYFVKGKLSMADVYLISIVTHLNHVLDEKHHSIDIFENYENIVKLKATFKLEPKLEAYHESRPIHDDESR